MFDHLVDWHSITLWNTDPDNRIAHRLTDLCLHVEYLYALSSNLTMI